LANTFFNYHIQPDDQLKILETEHQKVQDRRADLVLEVTPKNQAAYIIHIEIQNNVHSKMAYRMLNYYLDIRQAHPKTAIHQYVIYIGKGKQRMNNQIKRDKLDYQYLHRYSIFQLNKQMPQILI